MALSNNRVFLNNINIIMNDRSILNFAILFEESGTIYVNINDAKQPLQLESLKSDLVQTIYPDHLKTYKGQTFNFLAYNEPPAVTIQGRVISKYNNFLAVIEDLDGLKSAFMVLKGNIKKIGEVIMDFFGARRYEMTINTFFMFETAAPKLMTYEQTGYCVLVPKHELASMKGGIFFLVIYFLL